MSGKIGAGASFGGSPIPTVAGMEGTGSSADINVTPMIDVMLVLLIIFMVITPAMAGYTAVLPKAVSAEAEKEKKVTLGIDRQGKYYIEKSKWQHAIPEDQLEAALKEMYATRPEDHILYMKADTGAQYSAILTAINHARQAGVTKIGAITELPKGAAKKLSQVK